MTRERKTIHVRTGTWPEPGSVSTLDRADRGRRGVGGGVGPASHLSPGLKRGPEQRLTTMVVLRTPIPSRKQSA